VGGLEAGGTTQISFMQDRFEKHGVYPGQHGCPELNPHSRQIPLWQDKPKTLHVSSSQHGSSKSPQEVGELVGKLVGKAVGSLVGLVSTTMV
jgi:hypothetical protein